MMPKSLVLTCLLVLVLAACGNPEEVTVLPAATAKGDEAIMRKISPLLLNQIEMRQQQQKQPTSQRQEQMQNMGMDVANLSTQRVFIHLAQRPSEAQVQDMRALGLNPYVDSWIPPVGSSPTGFLIGDMPVSALNTLASKDYVVKLETAEKLSQPQGAPRGDRIEGK